VETVCKAVLILVTNEVIWYGDFDVAKFVEGAEVNRFFVLLLSPSRPLQ
jgi:hypothetical protein